MELSDTESSSWSVYSDCDCYRCQHGYSHKVEPEPFPFYSSIQQPFVYYAQCRHGHANKKDCNECRGGNCFVRAFRWYTNEHGDKRSKPSAGGRPKSRPCDPITCPDPCNATCEPPGGPCPGPRNLSSFASWLDSKYHQFLIENACNIQPTEKKSKKKNESMEFIMTPKNLSHAASECCHPTPTCSAGDGHLVKSQSATATVCLNKSCNGNQEYARPPNEARNDPYKTNKNMSCQAMCTGQNVQTQYEPPAPSSQPCSSICPVTPRCPRRPALQMQVTNEQPTQQIQDNRTEKRASTESHSSHKRAKSKSVVKCKCPRDPNEHSNKEKEHKEETKSVDFQQPESAVRQQQSAVRQQQCGLQQPGPGSQQSQQSYFRQPRPVFQQPCPDFQQPCPSSQQQATNLPYPCPSANEPCPGLRPCPTLREPCPPCEKSNLRTTSTAQQRENQQLYNSQTRYQQQGPLQPPPPSRYESQTPYQQSRFDPGPVQQPTIEPQNQYQQPTGPIQQGSQMYDYKPKQNPCCIPNAISREQGPSFMESARYESGFQEQYRAPGQIYREAGYSGAETVPGLCKTCSNLVRGICEMNPNRRCGPCPECNCQDCTTYGSSRCCKRIQMPPVKNVIITTAAAEGMCSLNCPYYASISNKGETTQTTVQFSENSRDTTAQTSTTAIQLTRSTNPEYKLFMKVVCADKP